MNSLPNTLSKFQKIPAFVRWKCFEFCSRMFLGKHYQILYPFGQIHDLLVSIQTQTIGCHVIDIYRIHKAEVIDYDFPSAYPIWFPKRAAYNDKYAFLMKDVIVIPGHAAVFIPNAGLIEYSTIGSDVFMIDGMFNSMVTPHNLSSGDILYPFATCYAYYHELIEIMTGALQARKVQKNVKFILQTSHPGFIDSLCEFFDIKPSQIICSNVPLRVSYCILVPHIPARSFASSSDVNQLHAEIIARLKTSSRQYRMIYISRRHAPSRSLCNEAEIENALRSKGFDILYFEDMSVREQFQAIYDSKYIVAPHGSGLANLAAARKGTRILEIISPEWQRSTFARLSKSLSLDYNYIMAKEKDGRYYASIEEILKSIQF